MSGGGGFDPDRLWATQARTGPGAMLAAPLPVGAVRWETRQLTFLVKMTFAFPNRASPADGGAAARLVLAREQEPLSLDRPSKLPSAAEGELAYVSDFVPFKSGSDVLVTGHAYAGEPTTRIHAGFRIGGVERSFAVAAARPSAAIPLSAAYLSGEAGQRPSAQQGKAISETALIELSNLSRGGGRLVLELPGIRPELVLQRGADGRRGIDLVCDTLWIDTDREIVVLVWRGNAGVASFDPDDVGRPEVTLVQVTAEGSPPMLGHGAHILLPFRHRVTEERDLGPDAATEDPLERAVAGYSAWEGGAPSPTLPLAAYARISAEIAEEREPRGVILERHGLDESSWATEERAWLEQMADGTMEGDTTLATEYGELFVAAQDGLARPEEQDRTLIDYVAVLAALEQHGDVAAALAPWSMTMSEWMRLERYWSARSEADATLAGEMERLLRQERARLGPLPDDDGDEGDIV